jgi:hypothetical protein
LGQTSLHSVHWWQRDLSISAFLVSFTTFIALEGHTLSHNPHPMQESFSTLLEKMDNLPNNLCNAPKGQIRLWNTSGLKNKVIGIAITPQIIRMGKLIFNTLLKTIIRTMLTIRATQDK